MHIPEQDDSWGPDDFYEEEHSAQESPKASTSQNQSQPLN
jgi:hypothetical protein